QTGPEFRVGDDSPRTQDFALQPSPPITGVVLDTDGKPVEMAEVLMATPTEDVEVGEGEYDFSNNQKTLTDAAGRFALPDSGMTFAVVAQADAGFAMADFPADQHDAGTLRLRPWASVRGRFLDGGKPVNEATIFVNLVRLNRLDEPRVFTQEMQIKTDVDGRFEFPRVPPAPLNVSVYLGPWRDEGFRSGPSVPLDLKPGQQVELDLGGAGAIVKGKVTLTGNVPDDLDCTYSLNHLIRREPGITPPPDIAKLGFDIRNGWKEIWLKIEGGHEYISTLWHWFVKLAPDGAYQISGVPAGDYDLAIEIYAKPTGCLVEPLGRTVVPVTVTADDAARGEMRLPEIKVEVVPVSAVGDTPKLAFRLADGKTGSLTDFRGKSTLVLFWASWCGPCRKHLPALKKLHEKLAERGYAVVGLALDDDAAAWRAAVEQLEMPWPQGRLAEPGKSGVSSVPAYWLLDADGKIVAKADTPDELAEAIK
ncbi:MAG: redoxin family protein, partial [Pirellulales bacterium]|nr:redoxin family protein [Pirellulales bacterium]